MIHRSSKKQLNNPLPLGNRGGWGQNCPLEIVITLDPTALPDKKKLLPYKKVDKQTWGRRTTLLRAEDLVGKLG